VYKGAKLLFLKAISPVHLGAGRAVAEAVDVVLQRDEYGIPWGAGSSIKGAIRSFKTTSNKVNKKLLNAVFGDERSEYASCISIQDARLLLFPVRALRGLYAYVTSRHLLEYCKRYIELIKPIRDDLSSLYETLCKITDLAEKVPEGEVLLFDESFIVKDSVILNEMIFKYRKGSNEELQLLIEVFKNILGKSKVKKIIIVSDNDLMDLIRTSLVVVNRVKLKYSTKTVERGGLWSEEYLPSDTVLVTAVLYSTPRTKNIDISLDKVWKIIDPGDYLILGGNETIGKGIVEVIKLW